MSRVHVLEGSVVEVKTRMPGTSLPLPVNTPIATVGSTDYFDSSHARTGFAERQKELGDKLAYDVVAELWHHVFCDVPDFLETMFPVDEDLISRVFISVKNSNLYKAKPKMPRWTCYPIRPNNEASLYAPFVELIEKIQGCLQRMQSRQPALNNLQWQVHSSITPATRDSYIPAIKPDIIAAHTGSLVDGNIPWSRIVVPIEVKKAATEYPGPAILQLLKYVRLIFRESPDRCFVFGIVLARSNIAVYLADRTGVIGSTVFDIHAEPKSFIRVIVGLLTFTPDRLGYDTSMSLVPQKRVYPTLDEVDPRPSYTVQWNEAQDEHYWYLEMPKPKAGAPYGVMDESETEVFVLYKAISIRRGGVIRGRATRVWKAWLLDEMTLELAERRVFVVKDTWRDDERRLEGEFYGCIGRVDGVAALHSFSMVRINGEDDKVESRIRRGLYVKGRPRCIDLFQPSDNVDPTVLPTTSPDRDRGNTTRYLSPRDYLPPCDTSEVSPRGKTHSRLVMESYGWSIRYAKSLLELVRAFRDAIQGYRTAYENGVIHRDMSVENIIINRVMQDVKGNRGFIIDFDFAKFMEDPTIHDDPISGTRPFMSGELLRCRPYLPSLKADAPVHEFQHDLESVLWILLWIALCKCGAGIRRPALIDRHHELHEPLVEFVRQLFEVEDIKQLGKNKSSLILYNNEFKLCLELIDDFYAPLKPLLWTLWRTLNAGYNARHFDFEPTIDVFLSAFDEAEKELERKPPLLTPEQEANVRAEEARRAKDDDDWKHTPRPQVKPTRPAGPMLEPLQALQLSHPDIPEEPAGLSVEDLQDESPSSGASRQGSPTPFAHAMDSSTLVSGSRPRATRAIRNVAKAATSTKPPPAPKKKTSTTAPSKSHAASSDLPSRSRSRATTAHTESNAANSSRGTTPPSSISSQSTMQERSESRASHSAQDDNVAGPSTSKHGRGRGGRGAGIRDRGGQRGRGTSKRGVSGNATKTKKK